jgi:hypothetical protein
LLNSFVSWSTMVWYSVLVLEVAPFRLTEL